MEENLRQGLMSVRNNYKSFSIPELLEFYSKAKEFLNANNQISDDYRLAESYIRVIEQALEDGLSGQFDFL